MGIQILKFLILDIEAPYFVGLGEFASLRYDGFCNYLSVFSHCERTLLIHFQFILCGILD
ncbi:Uncharacterised protein [Mycobacteroides abscessus subsp. abscessus]|nr:Uncharacterised protein [Mycobacteroides abscessus subsp. abscessus]